MPERVTTIDFSGINVKMRVDREKKSKYTNN